MRRWVQRVKRPGRVTLGLAAAAAGSLTLLAAPVTAASAAPAIPAAAQAAKPGSVLRLQELLAQLGYLPVTFHLASGTAEPDSLAAEEATKYDALPGSFSWRWKDLPSSLRSEWSQGHGTLMVKGALMTFAQVHHMYHDWFDYESVNQIASSSLWTALFNAALNGKRDPWAYSYIYVSKASPETLTLWKNGKVALTSYANTGIAQAPTADGTYPIYLRLYFQVMKGTNPNGTRYADPVYYINYFNGGDAVHGFVRASYGWPQSLGCVELPVSTAEKAFYMLAIGDLVTVS